MRLHAPSRPLLRSKGGNNRRLDKYLPPRAVNYQVPHNVAPVVHLHRIMPLENFRIFHVGVGHVDLSSTSTAPGGIGTHTSANCFVIAKGRIGCNVSSDNVTITKIHSQKSTRGGLDISILLLLIPLSLHYLFSAQRHSKSTHTHPQV